jgi:hypothetical protein
MNKRLIKVGFIILAMAVIVKSLFVLAKNIKLDEFHKSAIIFVIDASASNQKKLPEEIRYVKSLCAVLDPEDAVKILKVSGSSYLIYEGNPGDAQGIEKAISSFANNTKDYSTSYGEGIKKALGYCLTMKKEGYRPSVVVIGDLMNQGTLSKQINWETLPQNVSGVQKYIPELAMMFVYAGPEKLDLVKTKLSPVLGETRLVVANEAMVNKSNVRFLKAIGR